MTYRTYIGMQYLILKRISIMFKKFYSCITEVIDKHIPFKLLSRHQLKFSAKPWITPALKSLSKLKIGITGNFSIRSIYFENVFINYIGTS